MKIVTSEEMSRIEKAAFEELGPSSPEIFMDRVGQAIAEKIMAYHHNRPYRPPVVLLTGKGNNGGDAFVIGTILLAKGWEVKFIQPDSTETLTALCAKKKATFLAKGGSELGLGELPTNAILIDGLLGTGLRGIPRPKYVELINFANQSGHDIFSIDLPSGMNGDQGPAMADSNIICAKRTFCLGLPKSGMVENAAFDYIGELELLDFGIPKKNVGTAKKQYDLLTRKWVQNHLPPVRPTRHKYERGLVGAFAGSEGMVGAGILSATAALRAGAGLVKWFYPEDLRLEGIERPWELMTKKVSYKNFTATISHVLQDISRYKSLLFGPGLSQSADVDHFLSHFLPQVPTKVVLDADALNVYANNPYPLPEHVVMTPHRLEMARLLHKTKTITSSKEDLEKCQSFASTKNITLVLKGSPTFIFSPNKKVPVVSVLGDPGMATAGSGDVLTGIIAAFLAQGLDCFEAACVGTYVHGLAGKLAAQAKTSYCMLASDIIEHLPEAYKLILDPDLAYELTIPRWTTI